MPQRYSPADSEARFILIDLTEQFLGAYEYGTLVLSAPVATGRTGNPTPTGDFRIDAADLRHRSSRYTIANTAVPYPMHYGLRFLRTKRGVSYWIHGRDLPGYPASHGCVGLYDEAMQARYYGEPKDAELDDARRLFEWAVGSLREGESVRENLDGPRVHVVGRAPRRGEAPDASNRASSPTVMPMKTNDARSGISAQLIQQRSDTRARDKMPGRELRAAPPSIFFSVARMERR